MKILFGAILLASCTVASIGQEAKKYSKGGVSFEYAAGSEVTDQPSQDSQRIILSNKDSDSQVMIIVLQKRVASGASMADIKKATVDPWLTSLTDQYTKAGIAIERSPDTTEISGESVEGTKLKFSLDGQAGTGYAYWILLDKRLVLLYFIRPDKLAEKASAGWDVLRKSIRVGESGNR